MKNLTLRLTLSSLALAAWPTLLLSQQTDYISLVNATCGGIGKAACPTVPACAGSSLGIKVRTDNFNSQPLCDLPNPTCTTGVGPYPPDPHDVTFLVVTDTHMRNGWSLTDFETQTHVKYLNGVDKLGWNWADAGAGFRSEPVTRPWAIVTTGDDTDGGLATELGAFRLLYEGKSSTGLNFPLFPGFGNHDTQNDCLYNNCAKRMFDYIGKTSACLLNIDPLSHSYSWDWGAYHLIQLNRWVGDTSLGTDNGKVADTHPNAWGWLTLDLALKVGKSGRPVIIFQHFGWDGVSKEVDLQGIPRWWTDTDRTKFLDLIKDYNVAGIFSGHSHRTGMYGPQVADSSKTLKTIDNFTGGAGGIHYLKTDTKHDPEPAHGEFFIVRLTDRFMDVLPAKWTGASVDSLEPTSIRMANVGDDTGAPFANDVAGCRKYVGPPLRQVAVNVTFSNTDKTASFTNTTGATINGPLALQFPIHRSSTLLPLADPVTAKPLVMFMASCAAGPAYLMMPKYPIAPGETVSVPISYSGSSPSPGSITLVTFAADDLLLSRSTVDVSPGKGQSVDLSTASKTPVPFSLTASAPWIRVTASATATPAQIIITIDKSKLTGSATGKVSIASALGRGEITVNASTTIARNTTPADGPRNVVNPWATHEQDVEEEGAFRRQ